MHRLKVRELRLCIIANHTQIIIEATTEAEARALLLPSPKRFLKSLWLQLKHIFQTSAQLNFCRFTLSSTPTSTLNSFAFCSPGACTRWNQWAEAQQVAANRVAKDSIVFAARLLKTRKTPGSYNRNTHLEAYFSMLYS